MPNHTARKLKNRSVAADQCRFNATRNSLLPLPKKRDDTSFEAREHNLITMFNSPLIAAIPVDAFGVKSLRQKFILL